MSDTQKQVLIFPRGQLKADDRKALREAGVVAVEADDPAKVISALPMGASLNTDDVLYAALYAVHQASTENAPRTHLAKMLFDLVQEKRAKARP